MDGRTGGRTNGWMDGGIRYIDRPMGTIGRVSLWVPLDGLRGALQGPMTQTPERNSRALILRTLAKRTPCL